jgi:hypothetical protein
LVLSFSEIAATWGWDSYREKYWICGYQEFRYWYPQWKLGEAILDSTHDALPIYTMLEHDDVSTIHILENSFLISELLSLDYLQADHFIRSIRRNVFRFLHRTRYIRSPLENN